MKEENPNKKFFNKKEYNTIIVEKEGGAKSYSPRDMENLIRLLTDDIHRDQKHSILTVLKEEKGLDLLIDAILKNLEPDKKHILLAACWEAGLDCSDHLLLFTDVAVNDNYLCALEACTVIENMMGPFKKDEIARSREKITQALKAGDNEKKELLEDIEGMLKRLHV